MTYRTAGQRQRPNSRHFWVNAPLALGVVGLVLHAGAARAQTPPPPPVNGSQLTAVIVKGKTPAQAARAKLSKIPGGFSVVDSAEVAKGRVRSNADLLKLQPGVIAAATGAGGFDSIKVSIRGSGVNNGVGYFRNGIKYEFDDLPVTTPSGTPYELFDPQGLDYTEILRGDNAFTTGDLALGGTIDYHTNTGRTAPYSEIRTEFGSFGYIKGSAATGGVVGPWDYYINVIGESQNGWQQHSNASAQHVIANLGYQINDNAETRVYFRYGKELFYGPGALTRGQIESSTPDQAQLAYLETNYKRNQPGSELIGDVTKLRFADNQSVELGLAYQNFPIVIGPSSTSAPILAKWDYGNIAAQVKYENTSRLFGHGNDFTAAAYWSDDIYGDAKEEAIAADGANPYGTSYSYLGATYKIAPTSYYNIPGVTAGERLYWNKFNGSTDQTALLSDDFELIHNLWLTLGGAVVNTPRNFNTIGNTYVTGTTIPVVQTPSFRSSETNLIPRIGLLWDVSQDLQLFTSYGGNIEPREDWAGGYGPYSGTTASTYPNYGILNLKNQEADTVEVGFRGRYGIFQGSTDYYYAQVSDELLTIYDASIDANTTINAPHATHQGVESELDTVLWQDGGSFWGDTTGVNRVHLVQTFTWSDLTFNSNGGALSNKTEPGLPPEYYQGELAFDAANGIYANFDATAASGTYVDYLNTWKAAPYVVYGLTVGWQQQRADKKGWQVSLSVDNLTDTKYAVAIAPTYNANHADYANEYPGAGLGVYSAVDYKF
ncbi:MAG: TonB-dependent receptor family protein [Acidocella sp.]|uniref:TonB-dependent receptor family protein n=1 Tax=Acidocella sp. TaxID=50710 RepID=UPI003FD867A6